MALENMSLLDLSKEWNFKTCKHGFIVSCANKVDVMERSAPAPPDILNYICR